jgi:hypothetical protein
MLAEIGNRTDPCACYILNRIGSFRLSAPNDERIEIPELEGNRMDSHACDGSRWGARKTIACGRAALPKAMPPASLPDPHRNLTGGPDFDYFAEGLGEDLIDRLSWLKWLPMIVRSSGFSLGRELVDHRAISGQLAVCRTGDCLDHLE